MRDTILKTPVSEKKKGEVVFQMLEQIPFQPMEKTMVVQFVSLQSMEDHSGANIFLQHMEDPMAFWQDL